MAPRPGLSIQQERQRIRGLTTGPCGHFALVDRSRHTIGALDVADSRSYEIWIAGPAALLVAKVHKIAERVGSPARERDKDALDVLRLLRGVETTRLAGQLDLLGRDPLSAAVTTEARTLVCASGR